jgi:hypothetical protein
VDSKGNIYALDGPTWPEDPNGWGSRMDYTFPSMDMRFWGYFSRVGTEAYSRGESLSALHKQEYQAAGVYHPHRRDTIDMEHAGRPVLHKSEVCYLVKFPPGGGARDSDVEQWALRGGYFGKMCQGCDWPRNLLACDGADRLCCADVDHYGLRVVDTAGNLITRFGRYGNAETLPGEDGNTRQLGFRNIYCLAATGDILYVCDRDLRRIARVRVDYRDTKVARLP